MDEVVLAGLPYNRPGSNTSAQALQLQYMTRSDWGIVSNFYRSFLSTLQQTTLSFSSTWWQLHSCDEELQIMHKSQLKNR